MQNRHMVQYPPVPKFRKQDHPVEDRKQCSVPVDRDIGELPLAMIRLGAIVAQLHEYSLWAGHAYN